MFSTSGPSNLSLFLENSKTIIFNVGLEKGDASVDYYSKNFGWKLAEQPFLKFNGVIIWKQEYYNFNSYLLIKLYNLLTLKNI